MAVAKFVADKSAWSRLPHPAVARILGPLVEHGLVGTCGINDLEILFSTRNGDEHALVRDQRTALPWLPMPDEIWTRAIEVQGMLAERGRHRAASIPDLLLAATAERHDVTLLHYDADYDLIGEVTGQSMQWVLPRGSVP